MKTGPGRKVPAPGAVQSLWERLQKALFVLFLAGCAVAGPRHSFQPFLLQLGFAVHAGPKSIVADAVERFVDLLQGSSIRIVLSEQELFGIRIRSLIRQVYRRIVIGRAAFFFGARNAPRQLLALTLEFLLVVVETLLIHA